MTILRSNRKNATNVRNLFLFYIVKSSSPIYWFMSSPHLKELETCFSVPFHRTETFTLIQLSFLGLAVLYLHSRCLFFRGVVWAFECLHNRVVLMPGKELSVLFLTWTFLHPLKRFIKKAALYRVFIKSTIDSDSNFRTYLFGSSDLFEHQNRIISWDCRDHTIGLLCLIFCIRRTPMKTF